MTLARSQKSCPAPLRRFRRSEECVVRGGQKQVANNPLAGLAIPSRGKKLSPTASLVEDLPEVVVTEVAQPSKKRPAKDAGNWLSERR